VRGELASAADECQPAGFQDLSAARRREPVSGTRSRTRRGVRRSRRAPPSAWLLRRRRQCGREGGV